MTQIQLRRGTASEWSAANPVLAAGEVGVIGTTGDFKIGDGATTWNLLPAQSSRYVPLAGGVLLTDSAQTIATSSVTDITWDTEVSDPDGWHVASSATLTVPAGKAGRYIITYSGNWSGAPTTHTISCFINGGPVYEMTVGSLGIGTSWLPTLTVIRTLAAGDTIKLGATQSSGSNKNLDSRLEIAPI